jgi:hypothetical protein
VELVGVVSTWNFKCGTTAETGPEDVPSPN